MTLTWKPGEPAVSPFTVGAYPYEQSPITGQKIIVWSNRPELLNVPVTDNSVADLVVTRPKQYVGAGQWSDVIRRLKAHGIRLTTLEKPMAIAVTLYRMDDVRVTGGFEPDRAAHNQIPSYEGHLMVSGKGKPFQRLQTLSGRLDGGRHRPAAGGPRNRPAAAGKPQLVLVLGLLQRDPGVGRTAGGLRDGADGPEDASRKPRAEGPVREKERRKTRPSPATPPRVCNGSTSARPSMT